MQELKLIALDEEDLAVVSAHLQDAVVRVADMAYLPRQRRFAMVLNRFDWTSADLTGKKASYRRRRAGLRFERVRGAKVSGLDLRRKDAFLSLLAVRFTTGDPPSGQIKLDFSGGAGVVLDVECIEAELKDLGAAWSARAKPEHPDDDPSAPN